MSDEHLVLKLIGGNIINTLYNIGVGQRPHDEANILKTKIENLKVFGAEANIDVYNDRKFDYVGNLLNVGIWSERCIKEFHMTKDQGQSSFLEANPDYLKKWGLEVFKKINVQCITLDEFDNENNCPDNILIWMDIEGGELEALKGAHKLLSSGRVKYIFLEISHDYTTRRFGEPKINEINGLLNKYNIFIVEKTFSGSTFSNCLFKLK